MIDKNNLEQLTIKQKIKLVLGSLAIISCKHDKTVLITFSDTSGITDRLEGGQAKYTQVPVFFEINDAYLISLSPQITSDRIKPCMDIIRRNSRVFENIITDFVRADKFREQHMSAEEKAAKEDLIKANGGALVPNYFKELDRYLEKFTDESLENMNIVPTTSEMIDDLSKLLFFRKGNGANIFFLPYGGKMNEAQYKKCLKAEKKHFSIEGWSFYFSATTSTSLIRAVEEKIKSHFKSFNHIFEIIVEEMGAKKPKFVAYARSTEPLGNSI